MTDSIKANPTTTASVATPVKSHSLFSSSRQHSAFSATMLLMISSLLSGVLGLIRTKYIAFVFGAGSATDAYNAAFNLPDMINYFLVGGVASITLVSILNRHRQAGDEAGADRALSVVLVAMVTVVGIGIILAEIFAPLYTRVFFPGLNAETAALCTHLTRILLPAQIFFFVGGVLGSRLLVRKIFIFQAVTPLIYNAGIIFGGVFLSGRYGIDSLAFGVLAGSLIGSMLLNGAGAIRSGLKFYPIFDLRHPDFLEWLRLSLPLMIGVSLAMADKWILSYFATGDAGGYTMLTTAKTLFNAPLVVVGAAAGAASLPFFSSLFAQDKMDEFDAAVNRSVSRLIAVAFLMTAWMSVMAAPVVDLFRGGRFTVADATATAHYFRIFAFSLALWSAQGIYARAFYAARNTLTPAISGTLVTILSIPIYAWLFHHTGVSGLAIASDFGIIAHTGALAFLLHREGLVDITGLEWGEIGKSVLAAVIAYAAVRIAMQVNYVQHLHGHRADVVVILAGSLLWAGLCYIALQLSGSRLPRQILRRGSKATA